MPAFGKLSKYCSFYYNDKRIVGLNFLHNTSIVLPCEAHTLDGRRDEINKHIDELHKRGFFAPEESRNESDLMANLLENISKVAGKRKLHFAMMPTFDCNSRCHYCYESKNSGMTSFWTEAEMDKVIDTVRVVKDSQPNQALSFAILGGEILQTKYWEPLSMLLQKIRSLSGTKNTQLVSNGVEIDELCDGLCQYSDVVKSIQLTLDGPREVHDRLRPNCIGKSGFDAIMSTLPKLAKEFVVCLRIHIYEENLNSLPTLLETVARCRSRFPQSIRPYIYPITVKGADGSCAGLESIRAKEVILLKSCLDMISRVNTGGSMEPIEIDFPGSFSLWDIICGKRFKMRRHFCAANGNQYVFGPDSRVYKCWWAIGNNDNMVGDLSAGGIDAARDGYWRGRTLEKLPKCMDCKYAFLCAGGCAYKASLIHKDIYAPLCPDFDAIARMLIEYRYHGEGNVSEMSFN
ncbi:MAG: SPASM domain-containing protein [Elusimicrobiales bacterium]|nr:SPASM domain-containing protein [Elusimicrobiales bacterium]